MCVRRPLAETGLLFSPVLLNMSGQKCQNENSLRKFSERFHESQRRHQLRKALACLTTEPTEPTSTSLESAIRHTERKEDPSKNPPKDHERLTKRERPHNRRRTSSTGRRRRNSRRQGEESVKKKRQLQDCTTEMTEEGRWYFYWPKKSERVCKKAASHDPSQTERTTKSNPFKPGSTWKRKSKPSKKGKKTLTPTCNLYPLTWSLINNSKLLNRVVWKCQFIFYYSFIAWVWARLGPGGFLPTLMSVCVCLSVHWLCASDDETSGVMAWWCGRLTGMTMQTLGVAIRWQTAKYDHAKPWHGGVLAWWNAVR